jgi:hypothetical protein
MTVMKLYFLNFMQINYTKVYNNNNSYYNILVKPDKNIINLVKYIVEILLR